jgi:predicted anti-sigma-YlaC factor YlaD
MANFSYRRPSELNVRTLMGQPSSMDCDQLRKQISASIDGELSPFEQARVDAHLAVCGVCREYAATAAAASGLIRAAALEEPVVPFVLPRKRLALARKVQLGAAAAALAATLGLSTMAGNVARSPQPHPRTTATSQRLRFPEQELRLLQRAAQVRETLRNHNRIAF